jgi:hypothetical protein
MQSAVPPTSRLDVAGGVDAVAVLREHTHTRSVNKQRAKTFRCWAKGSGVTLPGGNLVKSVSETPGPVQQADCDCFASIATGAACRKSCTL